MPCSSCSGHSTGLKKSVARTEQKFGENMWGNEMSKTLRQVRKGVRVELSNGLKYSELKTLPQGMWFVKSALRMQNQSLALHLNPTNPPNASVM